MKLATAAVFATGYLLGTRAGRERYEQMVAIAERASRRLEDFSTRTLTVE